MELHGGCGVVAMQFHGATPCCVHSTKKAMATAVTFFFLLWRCVAMHLHVMELRCSSSMIKATTIAVTFFFV